MTQSESFVVQAVVIVVSVAIGNKHIEPSIHI